jgi:alkylation response protein AidB-like acyl-CoA dehydrogenase
MLTPAPQDLIETGQTAAEFRLLEPRHERLLTLIGELLHTNQQLRWKLAQMEADLEAARAKMG